MSLAIQRLILCCVAATACGPRIEEPAAEPAEPSMYAAALCGAIEDCECTSVFSSRGECEAELRARFLSLMESGLKLDEACFERVMEGPELERCASMEDPEYEQTGCTVLKGTKREGEACSGHLQYVPPFFAEECGGELRCRNGRCRLEDDPVNATEGSPCFLDEGGRCLSATDLYCGGDELCHVAPAPGETCDRTTACRLVGSQLYYCKGLGTAELGVCTAASALGEPCDPRDVNACVSLEGGLEWCDRSGICVESATAPRVCLYTQDPFRFVP
jgi:hypothetical protein